jgi:multisubunit Na+/H+ antiporter MnhB subunit
MTPELLLDVTLILLLIGMAWGALHASNLQAAIVLYISFGMIVALIWARLGAPDLALAEAAIGAGLTGVLLLQAARGTAPIPIGHVNRGSWRYLLSAAFILLVAVWMTVTLVGGDEAPFQQASPLPELVTEQLPLSGVRHEVTAVLLNFRSWDTLLELLVLLLALIGVRQLCLRPGDGKEQAPIARPWPLLFIWSQLLAPLLVLTGGYLLWSGSKAPGGAFQAGAVLAAGAVVLRLTGQLPVLRWSWWPVRLLVTGGALLFMLVAVVTGFGEAEGGSGWLQYPERAAGVLILAIEAMATLSIAVTLAMLVAGEREDLGS